MTTWQGNQSDCLSLGRNQWRKLSTLGNWTITDIVSGDRVESFTVNHGGNPANRRNGTTAASPVNGITDLSFERGTGSCCRMVSLELPDGREPAKNTHGRIRHLPTISATRWILVETMQRRRRSMTTWQENRSDCLRPGQISVEGKLLRSNTITDIVVSGDRVESFTVSHGADVVSDLSNEIKSPVSLGIDGSLYVDESIDLTNPKEWKLPVRFVDGNEITFESEIMVESTGDQYAPIRIQYPEAGKGD